MFKKITLLLVLMFVGSTIDLSAANNNDNTLFMKAGKGDLGGVKHLVEVKGANVNEKDLFGNTPLHYAAKMKYRDWLPEREKDKDDEKVNGESPKHLEIIKYLIEKGTDVNAKNSDGKSPLHFASSGDDQEIVEYLIAKGADVNAKDNDAQTPLHHASNEGKLEIVKYLTENKADVNAKNIYGDTPLHYAAFVFDASFVSCNFLGIVKYLVKKGADLNAKNNNGKIPRDVTANKEIKECLTKYKTDNKLNLKEDVEKKLLVIA